MEEQKIYSTHLSEGGYKTTLQNHACKGCGVEPYFVTLPSVNGISSIKIELDGWELINDMPFCSICTRKEKIKKILNGE